MRKFHLVIAAIAFLCFVATACEFGYRPGEHECRTFVWVRCGSFCIDYSQSEGGFARSYGPQVCIQHPGGRILIPKDCYRGNQ